MINLSQSIIFDSKSKKDKFEWCKSTASSFSLEYIETDSIDVIVNTNSVIPSLIVLTNDILDVKQQNVLLKTIEEPNINAYYVLLCDMSCLIETLKNRLTVVKLKEYTKEELKKFTDNEKILKYANTPDDITLFNSINFEKMLSICSIIVNKMSQANYANSLSLKTVISENPQAFVKILLEVIRECLESNFDEKVYQYYLTTNVFKNRLYSGVNYNIDHLVYQYIVDLWRVGHGY